MPVDIMVEKEIAARKSINWKYALLAVPTLYAFFLMIKIVSEPVEPIIIMSEPTFARIAVAPTAPELTEAQTLPSSPDSTNNHLLLPNESLETLPSVATMPAEELAEDAVTNDAENSAIDTDIAAVDKSSQQFADIELAKKNAKQKAKKKSEEAIQQSPTESKPQVESQPQQSIVVQQKDKELQKEPAVVAAETKKDTAKEVTKEAVKVPVQEKSPWSVFADSIIHGGEAPCTPAQIAMNQCS